MVLTVPYTLTPSEKYVHPHLSHNTRSMGDVNNRQKEEEEGQSTKPLLFVVVQDYILCCTPFSDTSLLGAPFLPDEV